MRLKRTNPPGVILLCFLCFALVGCGPSSTVARSSTSIAAPASIVATGSVDCSDINGSFSFTPPVTNTRAGVVKISLLFSGCATSGSNESEVKSGMATAIISNNVHSTCLGLLAPKPVRVTVDWNPTSIRPSVISFSGYVITTNSSPNEGFQLPNPGGSVTANGSFAGSDRGTTSSAMVMSAETPAYILGACSSNAGLDSLGIVGGRIIIS
jgi:hypothetical protein